MVVPGDILMLETGDLVAADGRLLEVHGFTVNESSLTGESLSVEKHTRGALYQAVGWNMYTRDPKKLERAIAQSLSVLGAPICRDDSHTVCAAL